MRSVHFNAAMGLGFLVFSAACLAFSPFVADDAHIVGRYALNAADGLGLVYNEGERVSALTSPFHALVVTVFALFTSDPVTIYRFLAPFLPLLAVLGAFRILRPTPAEAAMIACMGLASPFLAMWSVGGLETPILTAIITLWAAILLRIYRQRALMSGQAIALGALAGLAFITRFDSILITMPPLLALALVFWRRPAIWLGALVALAIAASWLGFAYIYYGDILPTSFYTKMIEDRVSDTISTFMLLNFFLLSGLGAMLPFLSLSREDCHPFARPLILGVLTSALIFFLFAMKNSGMHMMFGYRFYVPYLPALAILIMASLRTITWHPFAILAGQGALAVYMVTHTVNPALIDQMPGGEQVYFEYAGMRPADYRMFIDTLEQDAQDLRAHWEAQGRGDLPVIGMHTGGMGYWLRDFRVIEILVSYRHDCHLTYDEVLSIPDYVQRINFVRQADRLRATFLEGAQNVEILSASEFTADRTWEIDYAYRSNGGHYPYPAQTRGECVPAETQIADIDADN